MSRPTQKDRAEIPTSPLSILASASSTSQEGAQCRKQHLASVRYADPISWAAVAVVDQVLSPLSVDSAEDASHDDLGIIACSLRGPTETMRQVAQTANEGMVSPLRFPAANPGALAGVPAIIFGLRGPTLNFTMSPEECVTVVQMMANAWLLRGAAKRVLLLSEACNQDGESEVRCLLLGLKANALSLRVNYSWDEENSGEVIHQQSKTALWSWWSNRENVSLENEASP